MPEGEPSRTTAHSLLTSDDPAPFEVVNGDSKRPILLVCDHASRRFPRALADLGLDPLAQRCHLALDIGAGALVRRLADSLGATAVLAGYSRLVVDCNRDLLDAGAFLEFGDGIAIPGNRGISDADKKLRADAIYWPYHRAISTEIERLHLGGSTPAVIAIHSFTPVMNGVSRPWHMGILWDADPRIADALIRGLRGDGFVVGDNEPYSGKAPQDFTIDHHAESNGLPHAGIEIRQDQVDNDDGVQRIAGCLHRLIDDLPSGTYAPFGRGAAWSGERRSGARQRATGQEQS